METTLKKKEIVNYLVDHDVLISSDFVESLDKLDLSVLEEVMDKIKKEENNLDSLNIETLLISNKDDENIDSNLMNLSEKHHSQLSQELTDIIYAEENKVKQVEEPQITQSIDDNNQSFEKITTNSETNPDMEKETVQNVLQIDPNLKAHVEILKNWGEVEKKREISDFVKHFVSRYKQIRKILMSRAELESAVSMNRIPDMRNNDNENSVTVIGMVNEKTITKNGHIILSLEDLSGTCKFLITKNNEYYSEALDIVEDEIIGLIGSFPKEKDSEIIFGNTIVFPDIPNKEYKKSPEEVYSIFISDIHTGSKFFLEKEFKKFILWLNGHFGSDEHKEIASKVRYLFLVGDLVEGVGIYPNQDKELSIPDITKQYEKLAEYLRQVPKYIKIIICPGNHDAMRIAEPQPIISDTYASSITQLENVILVTNPSLVNIHKTDIFEGFKFLMYHGFSFPFYADNVPSIRENGGMTRMDLVMKFLLKRRHLAPTHRSALYIPNPQIDPLVIEDVPDFFVSGHVHRVTAATYKSVTMLNCSCWLPMTEYQEKVGLHPQPTRVLMANLKTRKVKVVKFGDFE